MFRVEFRWLRGLLLAVLFLSGGSSLAAQELPVEIFGEQIDVRVVNLEVVVEDSEGRRVHGLTRDDFRVMVDGREVSASYFAEVQGGHVDGTAASASHAPSVGTSYLVFIDNLFSIHRDRNIVLDNLTASLEDLGPDDRMAIVGFDGRRLELFSDWTDSRESMRAALLQARQANARGLGTMEQLRSVPFADMATDSLERKLKRVSLAVTAALRSYARTPGRKVGLLLSGGWPLGAMHAGSTGGAFGVPRSEGAGGLAPIYETANLLGYTLYPVGLRANSGGPGISAANASPILDAPFLGKTEISSTLRMLAQRTGGRALIGDVRRQTLKTIAKDLESYYWLGLTPTWQGDDKNHQIRVVPRQEGLSVRHRSGFRDLSREQEVSFLVESALLFGELPDARSLDVRIGERSRAGFRKAKVPLAMTIPMDAVTMIPHQGRFVAQLELRIAALDKGGDRSEMQVIPVVLSGTQRPASGQYSIYETAIKMRRQRHDLVVSLHDPLSGTILASVVKFKP